MKKVVSVCCLVALLCTLCPTAVTAQEGRGGIVSFLVGCCLGIREGTEYNEGKELHWREWAPLAVIIASVPIQMGLSLVLPGIAQIIGMVMSLGGGAFMIWNGVTCATGTTAHEFAEQYGTNWY